MKYSEEKSISESYKQNYVDGLEYIIKERQKSAEEKRREYIKDIFSKQDEYRNDLKKMLGWPLVDYCAEDLPKAEAELLSKEDGYEIYRMQFEILEGIKMTGLFFKQEGEDEKPLVIVQHGREGTPELISGVYGSTTNYNDMLERVRKYNVHVFAPQLLLWKEDYGVPYERREIDAKLKRVGSSITAVEIFGITKILDYFENQDYVSSFGMVGLSYGGFYTLFTAAVDTRIKSAISCSFFNKRDAIGWPDWVWFESAEKFDDAEITCLVYPRKLAIQMGNRDALFDYKYSEESFEKVKKICQNVGTDWVSFNVFDGTHEFCHDDEVIKKLIKDIKTE